MARRDGNRKKQVNTIITTNYSLYAKYTGEAVIMARVDKYDFWKEDIRTKNKF